MSSDIPKVSIIIPVYNVEQYLKECLESVLNQSLAEIEIICINDGSTDSSPQILRDYASKDKRIKVINKANSGYGHTMNVGLDMAIGKYIGFVESDDFVPANMYEILFQIAEENQVDFVKADFYRFTYSPEGIIEKNYNHLSNNPNDYNRVIDPHKEHHIFQFIMNTWSGIYNREFLNNFNIRHNETPGASFQDTGFWFQTFCWARKVIFLDQPFYMNRRDNPNSSVYNKNKIFCPCDEFDFIYSILKKNPELMSFLDVFQYQRYKGYMASLNRSADTYKMEFLLRFQTDFCTSKERGELVTTLFSPGAQKTLDMIMKNPENYYSLIVNKSEKEKCSILYKLQRVINYERNYGFRLTIKKIASKLITKE